MMHNDDQFVQIIIGAFVVAAVLAVLLCAGCKGTKVYPLVEIGFERAHEVEGRVGATFVTPNGTEIDALGGYRFRVDDGPHAPHKVQGMAPIVELRIRGSRR